MLTLLALLLGALFPTDPTVAQQYAYTEDQLKAVFLYNFATFVRWPEIAFEGPTSPIRYCVVGNNAMRGTLQEFLRGERVKGRPLVLIRPSQGKKLQECHVLYISGSNLDRAVETLESINSNAVLSVSDVAEFAARGGMINLIRKKDSIHLVINMDAIEKSKLTVSAKLLNVATLVRNAQGKPTP